jgi:hypothetical protein
VLNPNKEAGKLLVIITRYGHDKLLVIITRYGSRQAPTRPDRRSARYRFMRSHLARSRTRRAPGPRAHAPRPPRARAACSCPAPAPPAAIPPSPSSPSSLFGRGRADSPRPPLTDPPHSPLAAAAAAPIAALHTLPPSQPGGFHRLPLNPWCRGALCRGAAACSVTPGSMLPIPSSAPRTTRSPAEPIHTQQDFTEKTKRQAEPSLELIKTLN